MKRFSTYISASTLAIISVASMAATPQRTVTSSWTEMYSAIICSLPPPRMAGVTSKPSELMKTSSEAAMMPGLRQRQEDAEEGLGVAGTPRLREALETRGSMPCMLASSGRMA